MPVSLPLAEQFCSVLPFSIRARRVRRRWATKSSPALPRCVNIYQQLRWRGALTFSHQRRFRAPPRAPCLRAAWTGLGDAPLDLVTCHPHALAARVPSRRRLARGRRSTRWLLAASRLRVACCVACAPPLIFLALVCVQVLGGFEEFVGGPAQAHHLLDPLVSLCTIDETTVRTQAVDAINTLGKKLSPEQIFNHLAPKVLGLFENADWFTPRVSACGLVATAYTGCKGCKKDAQTSYTSGDKERTWKAEDLARELAEAYRKQFTDTEPMVRRSAALKLAEAATSFGDETTKAELVDVFSRLIEEQEQESIRVNALKSAATIFRVASLTDSEAGNKYLNCANDKSWRVRVAVSESLPAVAYSRKMSEQPQELEACQNTFLQLLGDSEAEVRHATAAQSAAAASVLGAQFAVAELVPAVQALVTDDGVTNRVDLAGVLLEMAGPIGMPLAKNVFLAPQAAGSGSSDQADLSLLQSLMNDPNTNLRLAVISKLTALIDVLTIPQAAEGEAPLLTPHRLRSFAFLSLHHPCYVSTTTTLQVAPSVAAACFCSFARTHDRTPLTTSRTPVCLPLRSARHHSCADRRQELAHPPCRTPAAAHTREPDARRRLQQGLHPGRVQVSCGGQLRPHTQRLDPCMQGHRRRVWLRLGQIERVAHARDAHRAEELPAQVRLLARCSGARRPLGCSDADRRLPAAGALDGQRPCAQPAPDVRRVARQGRGGRWEWQGWVDAGVINDKIKPVLGKLAEDTDVDVKDRATAALEALS